MTAPDLSRGVNLLRDRSLFFSWCLAILSGAFFGTVFGLDSVWLIGLVTILVVVGVALYRETWHIGTIFLFCFVFGVALSLGRSYAIHQNTDRMNELTGYFTRTVTIEATIGRRMDESANNTSYILEDISIDRHKLESICLLGRLARTFGLSEGDRIRFSARLDRPSENVAGFDYRSYLLLREIYAIAPVHTFTGIGQDHSNPVYSTIRTIRTRWLQRIEEIYPGESAILLEGILIGERSGLSRETRDGFSRSGLSHIVAVSGSNITIVLLFLAFLFRLFPLWVRSVMAAFGVGLFVLLVGAEAPVLRAACFGLVGYFVFSYGQRIRPVSTLLAIALVFIFLDPHIVVHDMSFLLSFLATLGLVCFARPLDRIFRFLPRVLALRESIVLTISATIATLPIMVGSFWQFSLIAPIANALVVPLLPFVMLFGFLSLILSFVSEVLSLWVGFITWWLLDYILMAVRFFGSLRFSSLLTDLGGFSWVFLIGWYTVIGTIALLLNTPSDEIKISEKEF